MTDEEFLQILEKDNVEELKKHINNTEDADIMIGCDIKTAPKELQDGPPLISCAAFYGSVNCFKLLLEKGANLNEVDEGSMTTLQFAILGKSKEILTLLLKNEKVDKKYVGFFTLRKGITDIFFWMADEKFINLDEIDFTKSNYAHVAAQTGNLEALKQILSKTNLDVNSQNYEGRTPLHLACGEGHLEVVKFLLSIKGINPAVLDHFEKPPMYYAHSQGYWDIVSLFFGGDFNKFGAETGQTVLQVACRKGNVSLVRLLLDIPQVDVNIKNPKYGLAAIHFAARFDEFEVMKALLESGRCDINIQDNAGKTALHYAREAKSTEIITLLLKYKANPNIKDKEGNVAIDDIDKI